MEEIILKVNGMMCEGCEKRIKNGILKIDSVIEVIANHKEGIVKVVLQNDQKVELIKEKIKSLDFTIEE